MSYRQVPDGWLEFSDRFIRDVQIGVQAGWEYVNQQGFGESLVYTSEDGVVEAWSLQRSRILGKPIPVVAVSASTD